MSAPIRRTIWLVLAALAALPSLASSDAAPPMANVARMLVSDMVIAHPQHQIMAVVADRPFDDAPLAAGAAVDPTKLIGSDGLEVVATWTLDLECP